MAKGIIAMETQKVVVWGTGGLANRILSYPIKQGIEIIAVIDSDEQKWGNYFHGIAILPPSEMDKLTFSILIVLVGRGREIICQQMREMHYRINRIVMAEPLYGYDVFESNLDEFFVIPKRHTDWVKGTPQNYTKKYGETSKAKKRREREGFFEKYCKGEGLDIGWDGDLLCGNCSVWDVENGDAQYLEGIDDEVFDFVYSSHCLEHMKDVRVALKNWYRILKPGGYLIIAVPHRDLYEKRKQLPSRWNADHKHMFLIGREEKPDTLDIVKEIGMSINNYDIKYVKACDEGHTITDPFVHSDGEYQIEMVIQKLT